MKPPAVLFVCARNAVRSPMAEALWRLRFGEHAPVCSAGVRPAAYPDGFMIEVMREKGVDLEAFECRDMEATADNPVELVVCLADEAAQDAEAFADRRGARFERWPAPDPALGQDRDRARQLAAYRATREAIEARIRAL